MDKYPSPNPRSGYIFIRYMEWIKAVDSELKKNGCNFLVSDNIVLPKIIGIDFFLMGSFLWSDIFKEYTNANNEMELFIEYEEQLLKESRFRMITNKYMAMPAVKKNTIPILLPWFCHKRVRSKNKNENNILFTLGGSDLIEENSYKIMDEIIKCNDYNVHTDEKIFKKYHRIYTKIKKFNFIDFTKIDLIICRPGNGILTEAVKWSIPVIALSETNKEIKFNSKRIVELGLGLLFNSNEKKNILEIIQEIMEKSTYDSFLRSFDLMETGGDKMAAEFLLEQYYK
jgi:hypothetical protein